MFPSGFHDSRFWKPQRGGPVMLRRRSNHHETWQRSHVNRLQIGRQSRLDFWDGRNTAPPTAPPGVLATLPHSRPQSVPTENLAVCRNRPRIVGYDFPNGIQKRTGQERLPMNPNSGCRSACPETKMMGTAGNSAFTAWANATPSPFGMWMSLTIRATSSPSSYTIRRPWAPSPASTVWKCSLCRMALIYFRTAGSSSTTSEMRPMPVWTANRYEKVPKNWLDQLTQKGHVANRIENPKPSQNAPDFLTAATHTAGRCHR